MVKLDLEEVSNTDYERDINIEIINRFYYKNVAFMNEKVHLFADHWMELYSNCCSQRDNAVELLNDNQPTEAKAVLQDWPDTFGAPNLPQLLFGEPPEKKRKKQSRISIECDGAKLQLGLQKCLLSLKKKNFFQLILKYSPMSSL